MGGLTTVLPLTFDGARGCGSRSDLGFAVRVLAVPRAAIVLSTGAPAEIVCEPLTAFVRDLKFRAGAESGISGCFLFRAFLGTVVLTEEVDADLADVGPAIGVLTLFYCQ